MQVENIVYVLRHALPANGEMPNRTRPLSDVGREQAEHARSVAVWADGWSTGPRRAMMD